MKIGIAGCGIAGTAVASLLAEQGHEVTLFEQTAECRPVGAGVLLQPSGQQILSELGLLAEIEEKSARLKGLNAQRASGRLLVQLEYALLDQKYYGLGVHRGLLFEKLLSRCQSLGVEVRTNSLIYGYQISGDSIHLMIDRDNDKLTEGFDGVVATDGSNSQLRKFSGIPYSCHEYQDAALWTTGPQTAISDWLYQVVDRTDRLIGILPIGENRASFFWGIRSQRYQKLLSGSIDSWKEEVLALCPEAREITDSISSFDELIFTNYRHVRMKRWFAEKIIFLGDAAHSMSPHLGQGVNLAIEDAACFARSLEQTGDFESACEQFTSIRKAKLRYYESLTKFLTPFFQSGSNLLASGRNAVLPVMPKLPVIKKIMLRTLCGIKNGWLR